MSQRFGEGGGNVGVKPNPPPASNSDKLFHNIVDKIRNSRIKPNPSDEENKKYFEGIFQEYLGKLDKEHKEAFIEYFNNKPELATIFHQKFGSSWSKNKRIAFGILGIGAPLAGIGAILGNEAYKSLDNVINGTNHESLFDSTLSESDTELLYAIAILLAITSIATYLVTTRKPDIKKLETLINDAKTEAEKIVKEINAKKQQQKLAEQKQENRKQEDGKQKSEEQKPVNASEKPNNTQNIDANSNRSTSEGNHSREDLIRQNAQSREDALRHELDLEKTRQIARLEALQQQQFQQQNPFQQQNQLGLANQLGGQLQQPPVAQQNQLAAQIEQLQNQLAAQIEQLQQQLAEQQQQQIAEIEQQIRQQIAALQNQPNQQQQQIADQLAALQQQIAALQNQLGGQQQPPVALQNQLGGQQQPPVALQNQPNQQQQIAELQQQLQRQIAALQQQLQQQNQQIADQLAALQQQIAALQQQIAALQQQIAEIEKHRGRSLNTISQGEVSFASDDESVSVASDDELSQSQISTELLEDQRSESESSDEEVSFASDYELNQSQISEEFLDDRLNQISFSQASEEQQRVEAQRLAAERLAAERQNQLEKQLEDLEALIDEAKRNQLELKDLEALIDEAKKVQEELPEKLTQFALRLPQHIKELEEQLVTKQIADLEEQLVTKQIADLEAERLAADQLNEAESQRSESVSSDYGLNQSQISEESLEGQSSSANIISSQSQLAAERQRVEAQQKASTKVNFYPYPKRQNLFQDIGYRNFSNLFPDRPPDPRHGYQIPRLQLQQPRRRSSTASLL